MYLSFGLFGLRLFHRYVTHCARLLRTVLILTKQWQILVSVNPVATERPVDPSMAIRTNVSVLLAFRAQTVP